MIQIFADFATVRPVTSFGNLQGSNRYADQMESLVSDAGIGGVAIRGTSKSMDKIADYYMHRWQTNHFRSSLWMLVAK